MHTAFFAYLKPIYLKQTWISSISLKPINPVDFCSNLWAHHAPHSFHLKASGATGPFFIGKVTRSFKRFVFCVTSEFWFVALSGAFGIQSELLPTSKLHVGSDLHALQRFVFCATLKMPFPQMTKAELPHRAWKFYNRIHNVFSSSPHCLPNIPHCLQHHINCSWPAFPSLYDYSTCSPASLFLSCNTKSLLEKKAY